MVEVIGWLRNSYLREAQIREVEATAQTLGVRLMVATASTPNEIGPASVNLVRQGARALLVGSDVLANGRNNQLSGLTARHDLPAIYPLRQFAEAGGLMSYEAKLSDAFHIAGVYTGRILNGSKPVDLPVQHSIRSEFVVNRNTAKWLGIDVPTSILSRADDIIE
jgi:putative ABC transport system substrate-binding protein